jgi:uncharacterized integral membrane protein
MIALIRGLISIIVTAAAILFALTNRQPVNLTWSPVNDPLSLPLFVIGLGALGIGFIAGALLMWTRAIGWKFQLRRQRRQIEALEKDLHAVPVQSRLLRDVTPETHLLLEDLGAP